MGQTRTPAGTPPIPDWPDVVRRELERRSPWLEGHAFGRVLDLGSPEGRAVVGSASAGTDVPAAPSEGAYDTVTSLAALTTFADLGAVLAGVAASLVVEGQFRFIEPVGRPGWRGVLWASAGSQLSGARGRHLGRDVPFAIRASGLIICEIERFEVATTIWPLRHFVQGRAVRFEIPVDDEGSGDDAATGATARHDEGRDPGGAA